MPNVWAHLIFGQLVLEKLNESELLLSDEHKNMFNMGCQGPDFYFIIVSYLGSAAPP